MSRSWINKAGIAFAGVVVAVALMASFGLTVESGHLSQDVRVPAKVQPSALVTPAAAPADTVLKQVRVEAAVHNPTASTNAWIALWRVPPLIAGIVLFFLIGMTGNALAAGNPFTKQNVLRIRIVAAILVVFPFLKLLTDYARTRILEQSSIATLPLVPMSISYMPAVLGTGVFLLAEAFASGRRAQEATDGLV